MARNRIGLGLVTGLHILVGAFAAAWLLAQPPAFAQGGAEIRYMQLNDETVGGRRLTFRDKTVISLYRNHDYTISGPLHVGFYESGGKKPTRGKWEVRYGNTLYVTMEDASSRASVFFKVGDKLYLRTVTGGVPNYGDLILNITPLR
jgi:hypothetical protein